MSRLYLIVAVGLLGVIALCTLNPSRASEDEKPVSAIQKDEISEVTELVDRIEELEKRLATLEDREPLIRQADSRETQKFEPREPHPPVAVPTVEYADEDDESLKTNGQSWKFRLLRLRRFIPDPTSEEGKQPTKPATKRLKVRTASMIDSI